MRLTVIGSGDAFGSGGRFNTCFHLAAGGRNVLIDCGASSLIALKAQGVDPNAIDAVVLSHLHGDHFGGIPFLMLDAQYMSRRERPLTFAGPPGTAERIPALMEAMFAGSSKTQFRFPWHIVEIPLGVPTDVLGFSVASAEVIHFSGAPSTALRLSDGSKTLAYSGDTQWTDALLAIASGADLFVVECYDYDRELTGHLNWRTVKARIADFGARRIMLTHMNPTILARRDELRAAGVLVAEDGLSVEV
jgi:ribonuclease BN (tRNA processing enzyme)